MRWHRALVLVLVLVAGCSLPLPQGVHDVGEVPVDQRVGEPLQVIPPGPRRGASTTETVLGFLGAQASSDNNHAVARQFLTAARNRTWRDMAEVQLYDPTRLDVTQLPGATSTRAVVRVRSVVLGEVSAEGAYTAVPESVITEDYALERVRGEWRLSGVADGLRLTVADRDRALRAVRLHYLARPVRDEPRHLVPDPVFLPAGPDFVTTLVRRQLRAPSPSLGDSVLSAVPDGAVLARPVAMTTSGTATVDITGFLDPLTDEQERDLSAQLTWTLRAVPSFTGLRLQVDGTPVRVPGGDDVQDAGQWDSYDPEGLGLDPPYFFTAARRLHSSLDLPPSPASQGAATDRGAVPVDGVAVSPDRSAMALLEGSTTGNATVRIGPLRGQAFPVVARGRFSSPSWGSAGHGLWLVRDRREVVRLAGSSLVPVPVIGLPAGRVDALAVARDGVRVSLVVGGRLYVGRVVVASDAPRVVDVTPLVTALTEVTQVSWQTGTRLLALGNLTRPAQLVRVAVDASSVSVLPTPGLLPTAVSASPAGVLAVSGGRLFLSNGGPFELVQAGPATAPAFPG